VALAEPSLLLVAQSVAIALGALPVYRLALKHIGSRRAGIGFALTYLLYPPTTWLALNEFHPGAIAMPALTSTRSGIWTDRLAPFAAFALFAAICREDIPLVLAGYGVWYALARGRRAVGATIAVTGVAWTTIAAGVIVPHFGRGQGTFSGRWRARARPGRSAGAPAHRVRPRGRPLSPRPRPAARRSLPARPHRAGGGACLLLNLLSRRRRHRLRFTFTTRPRRSRR
jgi:hypothetical protein